MKTSEDIAIKVREVLLNASIPDVSIEWDRKGYDRTKEVVIVPHTTDGEGSLRAATIILNIHVPDKYDADNSCYEADRATLIDLKGKVIDAVKRYYWKGTGISWSVSSVGAIIKEPDHNEHYTSVYLTSHIRERKN